MKRSASRWFLFLGVVFVSLPFATHADFEIVPGLAAEHAGVSVIEDVSFDGSAVSVINGADLTAVNDEWNVQFLQPFPSAVAADRAVYILARVANYDDFRVETPYSLVHASIPGDDGSDATTESQTVSFDLSPLGHPDTPAGLYYLAVYAYPDTKSVCQENPETFEFECSDEPYTEQDFLDWFHWQYEVDYSTFEGEVPITYSPTGQRSLVFEYVAGEAPNTCAENCFSNVLFIPGIKGSVLVRGSDTLWPPTLFSNDVPQLALNAAGESVNEIQVDGILETFYTTPIYSPFSSFLDDLVDDKEINGWLPLAYDWRYMPKKILDEGVVTPSGTKDALEEIEALAANSKSGKVTIVAHSMGGLMGKAIIKRLQDEGKDDLIDAFVMVGSPQLGTPQAISAILHGDGEGILGGFIVNSAEARTLSQNMPSAYNLLPSLAYFSAVTDPVITFDDVGFTEEWRTFWGNVISTYSPLVEFLTGQGVTRTDPEEGTLRIPEIARADLVNTAADFHVAYDTYEFPEHIRVVQVAGWGRPTVKAVEYTTNHFLQSYDIAFTSEGDGTVVYPSAISSTADETYFFDVLEYNQNAEDNDAQHRSLLNKNPVLDLIHAVVLGESVPAITYVSETKPELASVDDQLLVSAHSPVVLGAYDAFGNFTGIDPNQDLSAEVLSISEQIPGSSFVYTSEHQSIFLPKTGTYTFAYKGISVGPTTVTIDNFSDDAVVPVAQYSDIPTTEDTSATFEVASAAPEETAIVVDVDGDNVVDETVQPDGTQPSLTDLLALIKEKILSLAIKDKLKQNLLKKIENIEKKIEAKKLKNAKILANFKGKISKMEIKGKIAAADANNITGLVELLDAQSDTTALDADVLMQLKEKIISLNIKVALKNDLLKRVARLENKQSLINALDTLTQNISKKATSGKITDADAQALINLLTQIENAL